MNNTTQQFDPRSAMKQTAAKPVRAATTPVRAASRKIHSHPSEHRALHFPTQRPNEHVVLMLRRHWTILARDIVQLIFSLLIPPIVLIILFFYTSVRIEPGSALYVLLVEGFSLFYLFSLLAYFHDFVDYHLDIWVLTDQRVVSIEQVGLFNRVVSELNILRVQDVTSEVKGKVQTFLDYGQVHIQTAGEEARFVFEQVPHPSEVAKVILQVHDRAVKLNELEKIKQEEKYRAQEQQQYGPAGVGPYRAAQQRGIPQQPMPSRPIPHQPAQQPMPQQPMPQQPMPAQQPAARRPFVEPTPAQIRRVRPAQPRPPIQQALQNGSPQPGPQQPAWPQPIPRQPQPPTQPPQQPPATPGQ